MYVDKGDRQAGLSLRPGDDVPGTLVGDAYTPTLPVPEMHVQQMAQWNTTGRSYPLDMCVPQLVERHAATTPEAVALVLGEQRLSYGELNQRANQLAHYLSERGIGSNTLVGICMERSLDMVIGLLAVLKTGGAYVALDPTHPSERLIYMVEDAQIPVLVTHEHIAVQLPQHGATVLCMDRDAVTLARESVENLGVEVNANDAAYVIYTSGSTGKPKGVQVAHRNMLNLIYWHQENFHITAADRATQFASPAFDVTIEEIWPYLTIGASVYLVPDETTRIMPTVMRDWLVGCGITITMLPTALAESLMALEWPKTAALRYILTGGDTLYRYPSADLPFALINNYGPTEATVVATCEHVQPDPDATRPPSIGRPIANTQIYILDEDLRQVPVGEAGELYIGGAGVAIGYLNHPELTAERFIDDPFSDEPGARLYKTGDMARFLSDGQIAFMGRADFQVKIRGYRIEPNEIANVLNRYPAIQSSVVAAQEVSAGTKILVAYMTLQSGEQVTVNALRDALLEELPEYMVPSLFVVLDEFPINANGKVNRQLLPAPDASNTLRDDSIVQPTTLVEERLLTLVRGLLGIENIGIRDNFFYLGGHSLFAARLVKDIEEEFGKKIALSTLFAGPTVEQLAAALQQHINTDTRAALIPVRTTGSKRPFFFLHGDWTGGAFYCFSLASALGEDQPFYALEPYKFDGLRVVPTLAEVAAAHIEAMRAIQPEGPYLLGGFCNGGLVAYEMALQLRAAGQELVMLELVNPSSPDGVRSYRKVSDLLSKFLHIPLDKQATLFLRTRHALRHIYRHLWPADRRVLDFNKLIEIEPRLNSMFPSVEALFRDYVAVFTWITALYDRKLYDGKVTFYWAQEEPFIKDAWLTVIDAKSPHDIEEHVIAGTHMSCVTDHLEMFIACLSGCLENVHEAEARAERIQV